MIRDIDAIHGGESRIGYYVGLMVRPVYALAEYWIQSSGALHVLHRPNVHSFPLESDVGPNWAQTSRPHWVELTSFLVSMYWFGLSRTLWSIVLR